MWAKLVALLASLFAYWRGEKSGEATVKQADQTAALKQQVQIDEAIHQADAASPRNPVALSDRVRRGDSF